MYSINYLNFQIKVVFTHILLSFIYCWVNFMVIHENISKCNNIPLNSGCRSKRLLMFREIVVIRNEDDVSFNMYSVNLLKDEMIIIYCFVV